MAGKKYGMFEYGDVYDYDSVSNTRGEYLGRLVVNQDEKRFYLKPDGRAATSIARDRVKWYVANDLVEFDHEESRTFLIDYLMRLEENKAQEQEYRRQQYAQAKANKEIAENDKLTRKTKRRARFAKFFWLCGCAGIVGLGALAALPEPEPVPAEASIAGVGSEYEVDSEVLANSTYLSALGKGTELYGLVTNFAITESGTKTSGSGTVKENVLVNAGVSSTYPIHMRPLYYALDTFHQSQLVVNDSNGGDTGVLLQNPNGYSLGVPANEIVLVGGSGVSSIVLSEPSEYVALGADATQSQIEEAQEELAKEAVKGEKTSSTTKTDDEAGKMPTGWNGYEAVDVDANKVAASYWYTTNSSLEKKDLKRRITVWDIAGVLNTGEEAVSDMEPVLLNYQDTVSSYYDPVIVLDPSSNGSKYWLGYMKKSVSGETGFYLRSYETSKDLMIESYENTFSTADITNSNNPITNYQMFGKYLFFEQSGSIWAFDLTKLEVTVDTEKMTRTIKKQNPIQICKASDIKPYISADEEFRAGLTQSQATPVSHYQPITMTQVGGTLEYGIAFIESETQNIVFQPVTGATVASASITSGSGGNMNSTNAVANTTQSYVENAIAENEAKNAERNANKTANKNANSSVNNTNNENGNTNTNVNANNDIIVLHNDDNVTATKNTNATVQSVETQADNSRILIKAKADGIDFICFYVRGEQFYWIESDSSTKERRIMVSPIYYKNDANKITGGIIDTATETSNTAGIQVDDANNNAIITSSDTDVTPSQAVDSVIDNSNSNSNDNMNVNINGSTNNINNIEGVNEFNGNVNNTTNNGTAAPAAVSAE